jgi:hypothetical protein
MNFENLHIISPKESVDTYRLMELSNKVISFGSTTGVEATFWGACSILFGKSLYSNLETTYEVNSYKDLFELIETEALPPKKRNKTYPYGYYLSQYGIDTVFFQSDGLKNSKYKGRKVRVFTPKTVVYLLRYVYKFPLWIKLQKALSKGCLARNLLAFK